MNKWPQKNNIQGPQIAITHNIYINDVRAFPYD